MNKIKLSSAPLDMMGLMSAARHAEDMSLVLYSGYVSDSCEGLSVKYFHYEAHEAMASSMMDRLLDYAKRSWKLSVAMACHRVGKVAVGEPALVVVTAAPDRSNAYGANRYIIDYIKTELPIWKCTCFFDGSYSWDGSPGAQGVAGKVNKRLQGFEQRVA